MLTRGDQPRSIRDLKADAERYYGRGTGWLDRELRSISRLDCLELHARFSEERGKYAANERCGCCGVSGTPLPGSTRTCLPTRRSRSSGTPRTASARRSSYAVLPEFWRAVGELRNPVRRDLVKVLFLTGLRSLDCRQIRWEEVNLGHEPMMLGEVEIPHGCIHRPSPKGGHAQELHDPVARGRAGCPARAVRGERATGGRVG